MKHFTVADSKHADELIKLDFPENLITSSENCEIYLEHCNRYNMKFLDGSYGTIVHKNFNKYFEYIGIRNDEDYEIHQKLICGEGVKGDYRKPNIRLPLDHTNLFKCNKNKGTYILTSSPYQSLYSNLIKQLKDYPYDIYVIHPLFLDYHGFIESFDNSFRHPLYDINYAFTNACPEQMIKLNMEIRRDIGLFPVFVKL